MRRLDYFIFLDARKNDPDYQAKEYYAFDKSRKYGFSRLEETKRRYEAMMEQAV